MSGDILVERRKRIEIFVETLEELGFTEPHQSLGYPGQVDAFFHKKIDGAKLTCQITSWGFYETSQKCVYLFKANIQLYIHLYDYPKTREYTQTRLAMKFDQEIFSDKSLVSCFKYFVANFFEITDRLEERGQFILTPTSTSPLIFKADSPSFNNKYTKMEISETDGLLIIEYA